MAMFDPPHPGEVIRTEIIEAHNLTAAAAKVLGVSRQALSNLLTKRAGRSDWGHGAPDRKSFRPKDGDSDGHAVGLRHLPDTPARAHDQGAAVSASRGAAEPRRAMLD